MSSAQKICLAVRMGARPNEFIYALNGPSCINVFPLLWHAMIKHIATVLLQACESLCEVLALQQRGRHNQIKLWVCLDPGLIHVKHCAVFVHVSHKHIKKEASKQICEQIKQFSHTPQISYNSICFLCYHLPAVQLKNHHSSKITLYPGCPRIQLINTSWSLGHS